MVPFETKCPYGECADVSGRPHPPRHHSVAAGAGGVGCTVEVSVERLAGVLGAGVPPVVLPLMSAIEGTCTHRHSRDARGGVRVHR